MTLNQILTMILAELAALNHRFAVLGRAVMIHQAKTERRLRALERRVPN